MDDLDVVRAFVNDGVRRAFGPTLHVENDALLLDGYWQAGFRIAPETFLVRNEEPPQETAVLDDLAKALTERGFQHVGIDFPNIATIIYTELALGLVSWAMWAPDLESGETALAARAGADKFLHDDLRTEPMGEADFTAELGGARRIAGLPPALVLTVGLDTATAQSLEQALPDCRIEMRAFGQIQPDMCGALVPNLIVVDAAATVGREFIMELRAVACGRVIPVVAVTADEVPLGAETAVDPAADPGAWADPIRQLLP